MLAGIHLVEIDLLLGGERLDAMEPLPTGDYYAFVSRREVYPACEAYAWSIRRRLPHVPVPLVETGAKVRLDLDTAFKTTFDRAGYARTLRYDLGLLSELNQADRDWVKGIIAQ